MSDDLGNYCYFNSYIYRPAESNGFVVRLSILNWISRSHSKVQNPYGILTSLIFSSLVLVEEYFHVFENKITSNWSLMILSTQIGKLRISAWLFLAILPSIGCWFSRLIFRLVVFSYAPKRGICITCFIVQSKNLIKGSFIYSKHKSNEWRCPILVSFYVGSSKINGKVICKQLLWKSRSLLKLYSNCSCNLCRCKRHI